METKHTNPFYTRLSVALPLSVTSRRTVIAARPAAGWLPCFFRLCACGHACSVQTDPGKSLKTKSPLLQGQLAFIFFGTQGSTKRGCLSPSNSWWPGLWL